MYDRCYYTVLGARTVSILVREMVCLTADAFGGNKRCSLPYYEVLSYLILHYLISSYLTLSSVILFYGYELETGYLHWASSEFESRAVD